MKTLSEDIDDLDRMVDGGIYTKDAIRSQIRLIGREAGVLQAERDNLADAEVHAQTRDAQNQVRIQELEANIAAMEKKASDDGWQAIRAQGDRVRKMNQSKMLNHHC